MSGAAGRHTTTGWVYSRHVSHLPAAVLLDDVNTDVLAPLMLAHVTHRVLDEDGVNTEVAGANILCSKFRDR